MRAWRIALPLVILSLAGAALAQDAYSPPPNDQPPERVIVPWTYFGHKPAPEPSTASNASPPWAATPNPATPSLNDTGDVPAAQPKASQLAQPSAASAGSLVYEADISKKHPHPPEQIQLPPADQNASPISNASPEDSNLSSQSQLQPPEEQSGAQAKAATAAQPANRNASTQPSPGASPGSEAAELTLSYQEREENREARRKQLETAATKDPALQALAQIQETRLLLEGEQDRMQSAQQLSQAFASLANELSSRARHVRNLASSRKELALASEASLSQLNRRAPRIDLALNNLAMLPPGDENNQMIRRLDAELAQDDAARKLDEELDLQARHEIQTLEADAGQLEAAAAAARQKSASFAEAAQHAQANEDRLADRLEYSVARQRATGLLSTATKALQNSVNLTGAMDINAAVLGSAASASSSTGQTASSLRACIRKTGNVDACRSKGDR